MTIFHRFVPEDPSISQSIVAALLPGTLTSPLITHSGSTKFVEGQDRTDTATIVRPPCARHHRAQFKWHLWVLEAETQWSWMSVNWSCFPRGWRLVSRELARVTWTSKKLEEVTHCLMPPELYWDHCGSLRTYNPAQFHFCSLRLSSLTAPPWLCPASPVSVQSGNTDMSLTLWGP